MAVARIECERPVKPIIKKVILELSHDEAWAVQAACESHASNLNGLSGFSKGLLTAVTKSIAIAYAAHERSV